MGSSLQQRFQRRAGLLLAAGALTASFAAVAAPQTQTEELDISKLVPTGKVCIARASAANPQTPVERYFARQYESQKSTRVGRMLLDVSEGEEAMSNICFDRALDEENNCGSSLYGITIDGGIALNPAEWIHQEELELTIIHETRHLQQDKFHLGYGLKGNVPEASRVAMYWLIEADARMTEIVYGYEKGLRGDNIYTDVMMNDDNPMLDAFYASLAKNPGQMQAALEAGMKAFLKAKMTTLSYANETADWIEKAQAGFDPAQPTTQIFVAEDLQKAGDMAGFGNTMTPAVVRAFTTAFTQQDYTLLLKARERKNGQRTCEP